MPQGGTWSQRSNQHKGHKKENPEGQKGGPEVGMFALYLSCDGWWDGSKGIPEASEVILIDIWLL